MLRVKNITNRKSVVPELALAQGDVQGVEQMVQMCKKRGKRVKQLARHQVKKTDIASGVRVEASPSRETPTSKEAGIIGGTEVEASLSDSVHAGLRDIKVLSRRPQG